MNTDLPMLLLPGTLCDAALWAGLTLPPGARVLEVVRGRSLADAAQRALEGAPQRCHLIGFSLGAILAFELLRRVPERVARLTLISANPHAPNTAQLAAWEGQERQVRAGSFGALAESLCSGPHAGTLLAMARRLGPDAFLEQLALLGTRPDSRPTLAGYSGPLTLLAGREDAVIPVHLAEEMQALCPQAKLHIVPGAGHYLPLDVPGMLSDVLRETAYA